MLTVAQVKGAAPAARPYKISDAGGLYLHVASTGRRTWRMAQWWSDHLDQLKVGGVVVRGRFKKYT